MTNCPIHPDTEKEKVMSLGANRDYKTADRRARNQLAKHKELWDRLLADFPEMDKAEASHLALQILQGKLPYPAHRQKVTSD